jgi:L-lysine 2,3-aminomutase
MSESLDERFAKLGPAYSEGAVLSDEYKEAILKTVEELYPERLTDSWDDYIDRNGNHLTEHDKGVLRQMFPVDDSERYEMHTSTGEPVDDEDWAIIKPILEKYPKRP